MFVHPAAIPADAKPELPLPDFIADLDAVLRNLGVSTIVAEGVSLNAAIPNLVIWKV